MTQQARSLGAPLKAPREAPGLAPGRPSLTRTGLSPLLFRSPLQTVVRGSSVPMDGYISGLLHDIQKLSAISSNTLRGRSPASRRRAQSLGLLGEEPWAADPDMYLQSPQSERTDPHGLYLSCNGGAPAGRQQMPWPEPQSPRVLPNGLATKAQSLGPAEFQGATQRCLQLGACLQSSPPSTSPPADAGRRGTKAARHGPEEARPQSCLVGLAGRPGGEGSPSPKAPESGLKHRLFRSMFLSAPATAPLSSSKPGPPPQSKVSRGCPLGPLWPGRGPAWGTCVRDSAQPALPHLPGWAGDSLRGRNNQEISSASTEGSFPNRLSPPPPGAAHGRIGGYTPVRFPGVLRRGLWYQQLTPLPSGVCRGRPHWLADTP